MYFSGVTVFQNPKASKQWVEKADLFNQDDNEIVIPYGEDHQQVIRLDGQDTVKFLNEYYQADLAQKPLREMNLEEFFSFLETMIDMDAYLNQPRAKVKRFMEDLQRNGEDYLARCDETGDAEGNPVIYLDA